MRLGHRVIHGLVALLARVLWRIRFVGLDRVPATGPYILAPSHRSNLDSFFAALITRRRVRFMAKREIWKSRLLGRAAQGLGAFPVDRGAPDRAALRTAMECLAAGEPLVVFPEGTRRHGPAIEGLHDGAAYLSLRSKAPIVPIGIAGSEEILAKGRKLPRLHPVLLVVGEAIDPPTIDGAVPRSEVHALTGRLEVAVQKAFDEAQGLLAQRS
ncbi:MAG: 1-acyl-sn-glycerol-3-phosphate acyltransferase [Actinobacteria bacterium]|nr:1-acyl-sn-glycerol-3-phosphate acyltransferase [Actinomycetota bacterium]